MSPTTADPARRCPTLTRKAAAAALGVHPRTFDKLARDRGVPVLRVGRVYRVRLDDVMALFQPAPTPRPAA